MGSLSVSSTIASLDAKYVASVDSVFSSEEIDRSIARAANHPKCGPYFKHGDGIQLARPDFFTTSLSQFRVSITRIFCDGSGEQVFWIYARRIVAAVAYALAILKQSVLSLVGDAMCSGGLSSESFYRNLAVSTFNRASHPDPAYSAVRKCWPVPEVYLSPEAEPFACIQFHRADSTTMNGAW